MNEPTDPTWTQSILALVEQHQAWTEPVVFLLGLGESIVFVSLFIPSTLLFLAIGSADSAVGGVFWSVWLAGASGAIVGDVLSYLLGKAYKKNIANIWPLNKNPRWVAYARRTVSRYGMIGVIGGKFLGMARPFVPVIAGSMRMSWPKFLLASVISSFIWAGVFLAPGYSIVWFLNQ